MRRIIRFFLATLRCNSPRLNCRVSGCFVIVSSSHLPIWSAGLRSRKPFETDTQVLHQNLTVPERTELFPQRPPCSVTQASITFRKVLQDAASYSTRLARPLTPKVSWTPAGVSKEPLELSWYMHAFHSSGQRTSQLRSLAEPVGSTFERTIGERQRWLESLSWYFTSWSVCEVPLSWARFANILFILLIFSLRRVHCSSLLAIVCCRDWSAYLAW